MRLERSRAPREPSAPEGRPPRPHPAGRRRILFSVLSLVLLVAAAETASLAAIALSPRLLGWEIRRTTDIYREQSDWLRKLLAENPNRRETFDPLLGWRYKANFSDLQNRINSQGLRSTREYAPVPPPRVLRVAAFGDSFVYGNEVANNDSWPARMEQLFAGMEVLNYGVGGYGTDQAYLRFLREGAAVSPDVVLIGFLPDDLRRVVNVYRRFISDREYFFVKPRFFLEPTGDLRLLATPLRTHSDYEAYLRHPERIRVLGVHDFWYRRLVYENPLYDLSATVRLLTALLVRAHDRYMDPDRLFTGDVFSDSSTAFKIQVALLEKFSDAVSRYGAVPLVVIFPDKHNILRGRRAQPRVFDPLIDHLRARAIDHIDLTAAFLAAGPRADVNQWFMPGGHYSLTGNDIVASWLGQQIQLRLASRHPRPRPALGRS